MPSPPFKKPTPAELVEIVERLGLRPAPPPARRKPGRPRRPVAATPLTPREPLPEPQPLPTREDVLTEFLIKCHNRDLSARTENIYDYDTARQKLRSLKRWRQEMGERLHEALRSPNISLTLRKATEEDGTPYWFITRSGLFCSTPYSGWGHLPRLPLPPQHHIGDPSMPNETSEPRPTFFEPSDNEILAFFYQCSIENPAARSGDFPDKKGAVAFRYRLNVQRQKIRERGELPEFAEKVQLTIVERVEPSEGARPPRTFYYVTFKLDKRSSTYPHWDKLPLLELPPEAAIQCAQPTLRKQGAAPAAPDLPEVEDPIFPSNLYRFDEE